MNKPRPFPVSKMPEYRIWQGMIQRCVNKRGAAYHRYGGRGITVCDRWQNSFAAFYADMGPRPSPEMQLDRIDNDKGYSRENCRWATRQQNVMNREGSVPYPETPMKDLTPQQRQVIAEAIGTSERALQHIQAGRRQASASMAIRIERVASTLGLDIRRESLCSACRGCDLAKKARGA